MLQLNKDFHTLCKLAQTIRLLYYYHY